MLGCGRIERAGAPLKRLETDDEDGVVETCAVCCRGECGGVECFSDEGGRDPEGG